MKSILVIVFLLFAGGCSPEKIVPESTPKGNVIPQFTGESLKKVSVTIPDELPDGLTVLLIAFTQDTQFDVDRWILGISQIGTPVSIFEIPTIAGLVPGMIANRINAGMRRGIPTEDWESVITVYDDAEKLQSFTGKDGRDVTRVALVKRSGEVLWFSDKGYSARLVQELDRVVRAQL